MSRFVLDEFPSSFVSYEAMEVACHALESYCDRLKDSETEKLKASRISLLSMYLTFLIAFQNSLRFIVIELLWRRY